MTHFMRGSFAAGELSPYLYARTDYAKYYSGAKELTNMFVHPQGGVSNRAGTRLVCKVKYPDKETCILPFIFDRDETYILEFGVGYIRFVKGGGQIMVDEAPYEIETYYDEEDLRYLRVVQSADTLFIFCRDREPARLIRYTNTSWLFQPLPYKLGPFLSERDIECKVKVVVDTDGGSAGSQSYTTAGTYTFTVPPEVSSIDLVIQGGGGVSDANVNAGGSRFGDFVSFGVNSGEAPIASMSAVSVTGGQSFQVVVGAGAIYGYTDEDDIFHVNKQGPPGKVIVSWNASMSKQTYGTMYADEDLFEPEHVGALWKIRQNVASDSVNLPDSRAITAYTEWFLETSGYWAGSVLVQRYAEENNKWETIRTLNSSKDKNYSITGEVEEPTKMRLSSIDYIAAVPNGTAGDSYLLGKAVLQTMPTTYDGVVKIIEYVGPQEVKVAIQKDIAVSDEWTALWYEGAWSKKRGFPPCGGFFQDRLCMGGTNNDPFMFYMSEPGDYINFNTSLPVKDTDSILARILARQNGRIREIISSADLLVLTDVGEFKISSGDQGAISPKNIQVTPQSNRGCSAVKPVLVGNQLVFTQAGGSIIRDFGYTLEVDGYSGNDLTVLATHLFKGHTILDLDYQGVPDSIVWCVRDDGELLGLTYMKEQEVFAWHRHTTQGEFKSVCVCPTTEGDDDVYFVVKRGDERFIECMTERLEKQDIKKAFFVDCGLVYEGPPSKKIYGLEHLAGKEVAILADGAALPRQSVRKILVGDVEEWGIELGYPAEKVIVGLPYEAVLQTLPLEVSETGVLQGKKKAITQVILRAYNTVGAMVGIDDEDLTPIKWDEMGDLLEKKPYLFTGDKLVRPFSGYKDTGCVKITQDSPLPITILGIIPTMDIPR